METKTLAFAKHVREQYPHVTIGNVYPEYLWNCECSK